MPTLGFDGDLRVIYEIPDPPFTVNVLAGGYLQYVPDAPVSIQTQTLTSELWSRFVDWREINEWSTLAFSKTGGAFRFQDPTNGSNVFAGFDLRLINDWVLVPSDYPQHTWLVVGNLFPNENTGIDFDTTRVVSPGVSPRVYFSDSTSAVQAGLTATQATRLNEVWKRLDLDPAAPNQYANDRTRAHNADDIDLVATNDGTTTTVQRQ